MITEDYQVLTPAYGREYRSGNAAKQDFLDGKDFELNSVKYGFGLKCSIRDFAPGVKVTLRYSHRTRLINVTIPKKG